MDEMTSINKETTGLEALVCSGSPRSRAAERCCQLLRSAVMPDMSGRLVPTTELLDVYKRRMARPNAIATVLGGDGIVSSLERHDQQSVAVFTVENGEEVGVLLLDESASRLLTCFVGRDRRRGEARSVPGVRDNAP
jgi:hypothetical protein